MNLIDLAIEVLENIGYQNAEGNDELPVEPRTYFNHHNGSVDIYTNGSTGDPIWAVSVVDFPESGEFEIVAGYWQSKPDFRQRYSYYSPSMDLEEIIKDLCYIRG